MNKRLHELLTAVALLYAVLFHPIAAADSSLILAVHPYLPEAEIQKRFAPLAAYLGQAAGMPVVVRVGPNYDEHIDAIGQDHVDIAFMGPASYVKMLDKYGSKPLLARFEVMGSPNLYGVIFTRQGSSLHTLKDIQGKRFAFGDVDSTMSHYVPHHMLIEAGVPTKALGTYKFLGTHKNVALAVLAGDFDAGAVKREVFEEFESRGLRALATSPPTPDHLFVTRSTLPPQQVQKLREALLKLKDQANGKEIMTLLHKELTSLIAASERDYQELRAIVKKVEAN